MNIDKKTHTCDLFLRVSVHKDKSEVGLMGSVCVSTVHRERTSEEERLMKWEKGESGDGREQRGKGQKEPFLVWDQEPCGTKVGDVTRGEKNNAPWQNSSLCQRDQWFPPEAEWCGVRTAPVTPTATSREHQQLKPPVKKCTLRRHIANSWAEFRCPSNVLSDTQGKSESVPSCRHLEMSCGCCSLRCLHRLKGGNKEIFLLQTATDSFGVMWPLTGD